MLVWQSFRLFQAKLSSELVIVALAVVNVAHSFLLTIKSHMQGESLDCTVRLWDSLAWREWSVQWRDCNRLQCVFFVLIGQPSAPPEPPAAASPGQISVMKTDREPDLVEGNTHTLSRIYICTDRRHTHRNTYAPTGSESQAHNIAHDCKYPHLHITYIVIPYAKILTCTWSQICISSCIGNFFYSFINTECTPT